MDKVVSGKIIEQVATALPKECREHIIIIGSLAAGYQLFRGDDNLQVQTKDMDCVLFPQLQAAEYGKDVAAKLISEGWKQKFDGEFNAPGTSETPDDKLPAVRLYPPGETDWFIELLTVPGSKNDQEKEWTRIRLKDGDYGLPSFRFLSVATFKPVGTMWGVFCARPKMMALANLLEHPRIGPEMIRNSPYKRSQKDVGRTIAIALLSSDRLETWIELWLESLQACFPHEWKMLAARAGSGLREILGKDNDLSLAHDSCINGLLASRQVNLEQFRIAGERLIKFVIEPLEARIQKL
ncbi:MAG TPA: hypothetical protein VL633_11835 [Bacteroidota bacterium]|nr:hypothetical protein [Bacteroidota bacterium]